MPHIELAVPIALGVGLAAATGFRVFLPMLLVSAAAYTGHLYGYGPGRYAAPRLLSQVRSLYRLQSLRHRSFRRRPASGKLRGTLLERRVLRRRALQSHLRGAETARRAVSAAGDHA